MAEGLDVAPVTSPAGVLALPRWRDAMPLVVICLLPVLLYLPYLDSPFERDEGTYATIAQGLLDGKVPYRDLFDNKPPLVYGWYALSFLLFGETVVAPRILASVLLSVTTLMIFAQTRMVFPRSVAYSAAAMFALTTGVPFVALHANTEAYMLLPLVTSLATFTLGMRTGRLHWFLLAGMLAGLAIMTKQVAVWNLLALAAVTVAWRWRSDGPARKRFAPLTAIMGGTACVLVAVGALFFAVGGLNELVYANFFYNWLYMAFPSYWERLVDMGAGLLYLSAVAAPLVAGALLGLATLLRGQRRQAGYYLLAAWAVASAIGVGSGGRFFPHYFMHLIPAMVMLTAILVEEWRSKPRSRPVRNASLAAASLLVLVSIVANGVIYFAPFRAKQSVAPTVYAQKDWEVSSRKLGEYIKLRTSPHDTIFNLGREPQIYAYADRRPAVQFFYDWAYQYDEATLAPTISALREARPVYIIDTMQAPLFQAEQRLPAFDLFLREYYDYQGWYYFADVYKLKHSR